MSADPLTVHRQRMALRRAGLNQPRVLCDCGTCLRCRKRAWMRAARARLHPGYWRPAPWTP